MKNMADLLMALKSKQLIKSPLFDLRPRAPHGLIIPASISNLYDRPVLKNPDGSYSTTSSISVGTDKGETLIPTVVNGVRLTQQQAVDHFRKTGEHLGIFDTPAHANAYAEALHNEQARHPKIR